MSVATINRAAWPANSSACAVTATSIDPPVLAPMTPVFGGGDRRQVGAHPRDQAVDVRGRPDIRDAHGQKLRARVAVVVHGRVVDLQEAQRAHLVHPHGLWIVSKEQPKAVLPSEDLLLRQGAGGDIVVDHHDAPRPYAGDGGHLQGEPSLFRRGVAGILQRERRYPPAQHLADPAGDAPRQLIARRSGRGAGGDVVLADERSGVHEAVVGAEPPPGRVDGQDHALVVEDRDMLGQGVERGAGALCGCAQAALGRLHLGEGLVAQDAGCAPARARDGGRTPAWRP